MSNERISLKEAYDNRDVIAQIAILNDKLDSIPDADLTNVVLKTGDQIIDGKKTFNEQMTVNGKIIANGGVEFANDGLIVNGTLQVDGDIIQNGSAYDTHAEQVFTKNDLIVTRDEAVSALPAGQLSGIRVKKYNGADDLNLGVDMNGVMRVGDLGDEQPLATRDEASAMTSGALVKWDGVNKKMIAPASDIGSDTKPIKIVDGVPVAVTDDLQLKLTVGAPETATLNTAVCDSGSWISRKYGNLVFVKLTCSPKASASGTWTEYTIYTNIPHLPTDQFAVPFGGDNSSSGWITVKTNGTASLSVRGTSFASNNIQTSFCYLTSE